MKIKPHYGLWLILGAILFMWLAALFNFNNIFSLIIIGLFGIVSIYAGFFTKGLNLEYKGLFGLGGIALLLLPMALLLGEGIATLALIVLWLDIVLLGFRVLRIPAYGFLIFLIATDALFVIPGGSVPLVMTILTLITVVAVGIDFFRQRKTHQQNLIENEVSVLEHSASLYVFNNVWYLPHVKNWLGSLFTRKDIGRLIIKEKSIEFIGETSVISILCFRISPSGKEEVNIEKIFFGKKCGDLINNWIRFDFLENQIAYFADGSWFGWGGIMGGTSRIFEYLEEWGQQPDSTIQ